MTATLLDYGKAREAAPDNLPVLQSYLAQLIGEPFRFARFSYGDELTLHFGNLRSARSPKLRNWTYGAYILGVRASAWFLKAGSKLLAVSDGTSGSNSPDDFGEPIRKEDVEAKPPIQSGERVVSARAFYVRSVDGLGLHLEISDGSILTILPTPADAGEPDDDALPELADWELLSPSGLLRAGPGPNWLFEPTTFDPAADKSAAPAIAG